MDLGTDRPFHSVARCYSNSKCNSPPHDAIVLDSRVCCYFGLPEQIHSDQGAQFESELETELCRLWRVDKTRTTPYHPEGNGMVERNNRPLGDSIRSLVIELGHENWDLVIPQVLRAFRAAPHSTTHETANSMMLGRELRIPDDLVYEITPSQPVPRNTYVLKAQEHLREAHDYLRKQELAVRLEDSEEPPLYIKGDLVWLVSKRKYGRGISRKLQPKFTGPYKIIAVWPNHVYQVEKNGQSSVEHKSRLKPFRACSNPRGRAPALSEPRRLPNFRGKARVPKRSPPPPPPAPLPTSLGQTPIPTPAPSNPDSPRPIGPHPTNETQTPPYPDQHKRPNTIIINMLHVFLLQDG